MGNHLKQSVLEQFNSPEFEQKFLIESMVQQIKLLKIADDKEAVFNSPDFQFYFKQLGDALHMPDLKENRFSKQFLERLSDLVKEKAKELGIEIEDTVLDTVEAIKRKAESVHLGNESLEYSKSLSNEKMVNIFLLSSNKEKFIENLSKNHIAYLFENHLPEIKKLPPSAKGKFIKSLSMKHMECLFENHLSEIKKLPQDVSNKVYKVFNNKMVSSSPEKAIEVMDKYLEEITNDFQSFYRLLWNTFASAASIEKPLEILKKTLDQFKQNPEEFFSIISSCIKSLDAMNDEKYEKLKSQGKVSESTNYKTYINENKAQMASLISELMKETSLNSHTFKNGLYLLSLINVPKETLDVLSSSMDVIKNFDKLEKMFIAEILDDLSKNGFKEETAPLYEQTGIRKSYLGKLVQFWTSS